MIIYKVTNLLNNKIYIGQTTSLLEERWRQHCIKGNLLFDAIKKYGKENFKIEEIGGANSLSELNYLEQQYIHNYNSLAPNGYNILLGGRNSLHTEETKLKMRKPKKNTGHTPESRKHSEETKKKMSESRRGKKRGPLSEKQKENIRKSNSNRIVSEETKAKISQANKGKKRPEKFGIQSKAKLIENGFIKKVKCIELDLIFDSAVDAVTFLGKKKHSSGNIGKVCSGKRKSYCGYTWTYI